MQRVRLSSSYARLHRDLRPEAIYKVLAEEELGVWTKRLAFPS